MCPEDKKAPSKKSEKPTLYVSFYVSEWDANKSSSKLTAIGRSIHNEVLKVRSKAVDYKQRVAWNSFPPPHQFMRGVPSAIAYPAC